MQIPQMSDDQLLVATQSSALREQECSIVVLKHLLEVHQRRLWAERGFSSLWEYIRSLGYSEHQAYEREGAVKLMLRNVEAERELELGKLNLTQAASMERVLRKEEKETKTEAQPEVVEILISQVEGRSKRDTEKVLLAYHPEEVPKEKLKQVTQTLSQANFAIDEETRRNLEKYWNLKGKTSLSEVFSDCLRFFVEQKEKTSKEKKAAITPTSPGKLGKQSHYNLPNLAECVSHQHKTDLTSPEFESSPEIKPRLSKNSGQRNKRTRYIPVQVRRQAREAAQNQCEYTDEGTGRRCESRYLLQYDHIYPFTFGGTSDVGNIRVLCSVPLLSGLIRD